MIKTDIREMSLSINAIKAIERKGFNELTYIQKKVIPLILNGEKDLLVQSQTGTGKTAAFAIPLIEKIIEHKKNQVLILAPTRELSIQLSEEIHSFCGRKKIKIALLYGGQSFDSQVKKLKRAEIVIGTPGRVSEHIGRRTYKTKKIDYLILDEVDEMLKSGFAEDLEEILRFSNRNRRTYFFSATVPDKISQLAKIYTKKLIRVYSESKQVTNKQTKQIYFDLLSHEKLDYLKIILNSEPNFYGIIFCKSKLKAKHLGIKLVKLGFLADAIHGDLEQNEREKVIGKFRQQKIRILAATDVAARGLDIPNLTHIINYSLPQNSDSYVHRIGRTGRAGKPGIAITFVTPEDDSKFIRFRKVLNQNIFHDQIENYQQKKVEIKDDIRENVRLFFSLGTKNNFTKQKLVEYINKHTEITGENLSHIIVAETFAFVTVSKINAEKILKVFKNVKNGKRKMVEFAKESKNAKKLSQ
jgi:ATP-dependent RNA helicase DeaD